MIANRVAGHTLPREGRLYDAHGYPVRVGRARCSCGETSPEMATVAARRRWHRDHKFDVRVAAAARRGQEQ